ncbi:MAG: ATP-dependent DNA helicase RecG [Bacteroidetes bacterium]|nr:MAG: ATP-dependent DNA helicase RecG [Bacteroidota bacterium]
MQDNQLLTPIEYLKGVGPARADLLKKELGIFTFSDLLSFYPFRYIDRTKFHKINEIDQNAAYIQLKGRLINMRTEGARRSKRLIAQVADDTGKIELIWFRGVTWMAKYLQPNEEYIIFGKPNYFKGRYNIPHPEIEPVKDELQNVGSNLQPVYHSTEKLKSRGLTSRGIMKLQQQLHLKLNGQINEFIPPIIANKYKLLNRKESFCAIHFPEDLKVLKKAQARLKFEELFLIQLRILKLKLNRDKLKGHVFENLGDNFYKFYNEILPFELTTAQKKVLKEIRKDVLSGTQMNRLLQGDVGSGKTIVALMSILQAIDNGYQACFMAPTEILANQHLESIYELVKPLELKVELLTGSSKTAKRRDIDEQLLSGELNILIGTHALIEDKVQFKNLGIVIIDEQHRFGVEQRAKMWKKNTIAPHVLVMTATPIPRTLAMTLYGDLDVSVIDELPPGRKTVKTIHRFDSHRLRAFGFMKEQIKLGRQVYVVYPLIKESETLDYKDLMDGYESICRTFQMPEYQVSIVHGQMKSADKDYEMQRFVKKETQIMVATSVIEVGVNIPNASVMIIESAERFGLSQLHQLRGRVGRGADQSYCILMSGNKLSNDALARLRTMVDTNDGFEIAEVDLKLRGPGDLEGTQQSGILDLRIADLARDTPILIEARYSASELLNSDPDLNNTENLLLKNHLTDYNKRKGNWSRIS